MKKKKLDKTRDELIARKLAFDNGYKVSIPEELKIDDETIKEADEIEFHEEEDEIKKKSKCTFYISESVLNDFNIFFLTLKMQENKITRSDLITEAINDLIKKKKYS